MGYHILGCRIIVFLMVMLEVVLILGLTTSPPKTIILEDIGILWGVVCIRSSENHNSLCRHSVRIIQIMLLVVVNLLLVIVMYMVNVVWVLGPPTFPPKMLVVVLMVLKMCHIILGVIHKYESFIKIKVLLFIIS